MTKLKKKLILKSKICNDVRSNTRKLNLFKVYSRKKCRYSIRDAFSNKGYQNIKKTISSAVANAENNFQYDIDKLI